MKASVKIMRSYDYNHFEVSLSSDEDMTLEQIDVMRKEAARLVDKAVTQYQLMKKYHSAKANAKMRDDKQLRHDRSLAIKTPESERTESEKAVIKAYDDHIFMLNHDWDYQDWWYGRLSDII